MSRLTRVVRLQLLIRIDKVEDLHIDENSHEEYFVMDKARRLQLTKEMIEAAGIDGNKVKVHMEDGKIIIESGN